MNEERCLLGSDLDGLILAFLSPRDTPNAIFALSTRFTTTKEWTRSLQQTEHRDKGSVIRVHGIVHAEDEAAVCLSGKKVWHKWGIIHRDNGPALERVDGTKEWWVDGELSRTDGAAIERANGTKEWWVDGNLHRENGPAIERANGTKEWWVKGKRHRIDGPAVMNANGKREWWVNGERHRMDGPAIKWPDGSKQWWIHNVHQTRPVFR